METGRSEKTSFQKVFFLNEFLVWHLNSHWFNWFNAFREVLKKSRTDLFCVRCQLSLSSCSWSGLFSYWHSIVTILYLAWKHDLPLNVRAPDKKHASGPYVIDPETSLVFSHWLICILYLSLMINRNNENWNWSKVCSLYYLWAKNFNFFNPITDDKLC